MTVVGVGAVVRLGAIVVVLGSAVTIAFVEHPIARERCLLRRLLALAVLAAAPSPAAPAATTPPAAWALLFLAPLPIRATAGTLVARRHLIPWLSRLELSIIVKSSRRLPALLRPPGGLGPAPLRRPRCLLRRSLLPAVLLSTIARVQLAAIPLILPAPLLGPILWHAITLATVRLPTVRPAAVRPAPILPAAILPAAILLRPILLARTLPRAILLPLTLALTGPIRLRAILLRAPAVLALPATLAWLLGAIVALVTTALVRTLIAGCAPALAVASITSLVLLTRRPSPTLRLPRLGRPASTICLRLRLHGFFAFFCALFVAIDVVTLFVQVFDRPAPAAFLRGTPLVTLLLAPIVKPPPSARRLLRRVGPRR